MPPADDFGLVGQTIDQLRFEKVVDGGGFGLVYRATHEGLGEPVAVKCLRLHQSIDSSLTDSFFQRFKDETRILYRLSQGSLDIVRGISSGTLTSPKTGEGVPYMVLEWLDGHPLTKELRVRALAQRPYTIEETMALLDPVFSALAHAHGQGIVHRDIKPGNLFFTRGRDGAMRLKVLDFGLAKIFEPTLGVVASVQTMGGVALCSPSYGAPEQFLNRFGPIGPWTDVYALALLILELLTMRKVRRAESLAEALMKAIEKETASPTAASLGLELAPEVARVLERAVARETTARPADAGKLREELLAAIAAAAAPSPPKAASRESVTDDLVATMALPDRAFALARAAAFGGGAPPGAQGAAGLNALQQTAMLPPGAFGTPANHSPPSNPPPAAPAASTLPLRPAAPIPAAGRPPSHPPPNAVAAARAAPAPSQQSQQATTAPVLSPARPSPPPPEPKRPDAHSAAVNGHGGIVARSPSSPPRSDPSGGTAASETPNRTRGFVVGLLVVLTAFAIVAAYIYYDKKVHHGAHVPPAALSRSST